MLLEPERSQISCHFFALPSRIVTDPGQTVVRDSQLVRRLVIGFVYERALLSHSGLHPIDNSLFLGDDCVRRDHLMMTNLFTHKLITVVECRLDLKVTRLTRCQAHDLTDKQIGAHN